jgi:actin related protein 2/3 complex subunit 1A/1B
MACMDVKWSPDGRKFAVASGSKKAMICFYEPTNNWWVAKETRKHKSTVLALAWHPSGLVLATVATDYTARIFSARIEEVDGVQNAAMDSATPFGVLPDAGELITEFEVTRAWLNDVSWGPSGRTLGFVGHDSLLHVVTFGAFISGSEPVAPTLQTIKCPTLPATRVLFLSDEALVTVGHSMNPEIYTRNAATGAWSFSFYADIRAEIKKEEVLGGVAAARAMFASKTSKGQSSQSNIEAEIWTKHQNAIVSIKAYTASSSSGTPVIKSFSTSGNDGRVVIWNLSI